MEYFDEKSVAVTVDKVNKKVNINILVYITNPDDDEETYGRGEYLNVWIDWDGSGRFDDNEDIVYSMTELLEIYGIDVVGKGYNGLEAVELFEKFSPDVVLLDLMMPQYDGLYALRKIREIS